MQIARDKTGAAPPGGTHRALGAAAVLFLLLGGATPAAAQAIRLFQLEDFGGIVEGGFLADLQDRSRSVSSGSEFNRVELSQLMDLDAHGYVYHPRFLTFDTGVKLEGIEGLAGQSANRLLWGGDLRFNFFQSHRNSLSLYGSRFESEFARAFSETYSLTSENYGATFFQKWGWIPFDLSYSHGTTKGGSGSQLDDSRDRMTFAGRYRIGERSDGRLEYDLIYEEIQGRDLRRQHLFASNASFIGDRTDKTLHTDVRLIEEKDGRQQRNANANAIFDWKHAENLRTHYALSGYLSDSEVQTSTNLNAGFLLAHQLYESLETDLELFSRLEDASFRTRKEFGGRLTENYLKWLGDWGRLNVSVSPHASIAYNRLDEDTAFVFEEAHVLTGTQFVVLRQADIIESSIVVTDENGSIVYGAGDYTITQIGGGLETRLVRTALSNIADGERVHVNYEYELAGDNDTLTTGVGVHTSLSFLNHWLVFAHYDTVDFHVLSGDEDALRFNSFDRYAAGMEYNRLWFSAKAKFEENDARITPSRGFSGSASLSTYGVESWRGRLTADYAYENQGSSALTVNRFGVSAAASRQFFKWGMLEGEGSWMRGRWSGMSSEANDIDTIYLRVRHSWWYGKVEVKLETGFARILRPTEDSDVYTVNLRVRRVF